MNHAEYQLLEQQVKEAENAVIQASNDEQTGVITTTQRLRIFRDYINKLDTFRGVKNG